ncbi:hypothetical protein F4820DRAFT_467538 [Hypoxylon rubiginosum]|uniref:Uncharacterized protein n=1 Tax=Hypoxylon rubiginosum TaxID=110542 RepID=A0ACB9Z8I5_9PEZI|nr:hypothetical protein F4820DRAFT_467538 [Hypoxylon rubiginosum]
MAALAHLGVQYMPSTGACMIDMAAAQANLFDVCGSIHIRMPETQHDIDVQSGMICIKPTQPANPVLATYREQYMYPPLAANSPPQGPASFEAPQSKPVEGGNVESSKPDDIPNVPADQPKGQSPSIQTQEAIPATPSTTTTSKCTSSMMFVTSTFLTQVTTSVYRGHLSTFITATPSTLTSTSTSTSATLEQPPVHIPTPPPAPTAAPPAPATPAQEPPASPTPPAPVRPAHPDHPAPPHPAPVYCDAEYFRMDVTTISGLDPHDLSLYLDLLGVGKLGLDLDHGLSGLVGGLLGGAVDDDETRVIHKELEHAYRVRCGVPLPRHEKGEGEKKEKKKGKKHGKHGKHEKGEKGERGEEEVEFPRHDKVLTVNSRTECVEECEMGAIEKARDSKVRECLGAAWHPRLARENCRYWTGASDEVLPVDELGREETGEWEFVYL